MILAQVCAGALWGWRFHPKVIKIWLDEMIFPIDHPDSLAYTLRHNGRLAQLGEHLVYTERVGGSSPSPPTSIPERGAQPEITDLRLFCV